MAYVVDFEILASMENSFLAIYKEVESWIEQPYKLFRTYSVEYWHKMLVARGMVLP